MAMVVNERSHGGVRGLVVTRYGHGLQPGESVGDIEILEASHPLADDASVAAGRQLLACAETVRSGETLLFLVSGGGSALSVAPLSNISLQHKRAAFDYLMRRGADIREINCVRRHLSALKGGRLARAAHPARVVTLAISDVPGDAIGDIASGPTIPDPTTAEQARSVLQRYRFPGLEDIEHVFTDPTLESPKPGNADFEADHAEIIASASTALEAAQELLESEGYRVHQLGDDLSSEASVLGAEHAQLAMREASSTQPVALLSGGETRVVMTADSGRGGRNLEYLAGMALELNGHRGVVALAADTDGIDGNADNAGGIVVPDLLARGQSAGLDLAELLARNDTYRFFHACKLLIKTGPTRTNVNDFRLILINPER
jgi:glycerate 2-kinase